MTEALVHHETIRHTDRQGLMTLITIRPGLRTMRSEGGLSGYAHNHQMVLNGYVDEEAQWRDPWICELDGTVRALTDDEQWERFEQELRSRD